MTHINNRLLDFIYKHIEETDWLEGLDLYQGGKVKDLSECNNLITSKITSRLNGSYEVRLKIHPNGHVIQWIECTCKKNRKSGQYCDHIAAFMIAIDREKPKLVNKLDGKMPVKHPAIKKPALANDSYEKSRSASASETLLEHSDIHSVSLLAHGPCIRIRLMIKPGQLTHYDLDLDNSAKFLKEHLDSEYLSSDLKKLTVSKNPAMMGTRIHQPIEENAERIIVEKLIGVEITEQKKNKENRLGDCSSVIDTFTCYSNIDLLGKKAVYELFLIKEVEAQIGKEFIFIPDYGYMPIFLDHYNPTWLELPLKKTYIDDSAVKLVKGGFKEYLSYGPLWLDSSFLEQSITINEKVELTTINIDKEQDGWFFLDPNYSSGEDTVSMVDLISHYRNKKRNYLRAGKKWIKIPDFIKDLDWNLDDTGKFIKVDTLGLIRLKAAVGDFDAFVGSKNALNKIRNKLEFHNNIKVPSITHTNLSLRGYQQNGLEWMWWLYENNLHGLLADEMGLGKTHQAMGLMSAIQKFKIGEKARFLVISPTTVLDHWFDKMTEFCPNLNPIKHHGNSRKLNYQNSEKTPITLITSFGILVRDIKELENQTWDAVIIDEAHFAKNQNTMTYRTLIRLKSRVRFCLTGTPIENNLSEIKNIIDILVPGYLGSDDYFKKNFITPIEQGDAPEQVLRLQKLLHPFKMRRTKDQVLKDLPAKVEDTRRCGLSNEQIQLYKNVLATRANPLIDQLKDTNKSIPYLHIFATLALLKQICDHPALILPDSSYKDHKSEKFDLLKEILHEALGSNHKIVIYSQYVKMITIISSYLDENKIEHAVLTGQSRIRGQIVKRFQTEDNCKVFLGSLMAGGIGIDLTAASVVLHYDRWWNASKENQATDRVHRIGQHNNIQVLKLICKGTLEEKIDTLINKKRDLFQKFMDHDEDIFKQFDRRQLIELLE